MKIEILFGFEVVWVLFRGTDAVKLICVTVSFYNIFLKVSISHSIVKFFLAFNATRLAGSQSKTDDGAICIKVKHNKENV